jgi:hypothetical protein
MVTGHEASSTTQNEVEGLFDPQHDLLNNENLPKIRTLARLVATNSSSALLAAWGLINLIGWWTAFAENTKLLRNISESGSWIWIFLYSGLVIGCAMLLFAAIGALARSASTIALNGASLILVGSWNVLSSAVLESQLSSAGYTLGGLDNLYGLLGICQIIWGGVRLRSAIRVSRWRCSTLSRRELSELRIRLENFIRKDEGKNPRIVRATILGTGILGFFKSKTTYHAQLSEGIAIFVSDTLNDCFVIPLESIPKADFSENRLKVSADDGTRVLFIWPESMSAFRRWGLHAFPDPRGPVYSATTPAVATSSEASAQPLPLGIPKVPKNLAKIGVGLLAAGSLTTLTSFFVSSNIAPFFTLFGFPSVACGVWLLIRAGRNRRRQWEEGSGR